jgi:hypothetical protein
MKLVTRLVHELSLQPITPHSLLSPQRARASEVPHQRPLFSPAFLLSPLLRDPCTPPTPDRAPRSHPPPSQTHPGRRRCASPTPVILPLACCSASPAEALGFGVGGTQLIRGHHPAQSRPSPYFTLHQVVASSSCNGGQIHCHSCERG